MTACIDLAARFGDRHRIGWEADGVTKALWQRQDWPWLMRIACCYGEVGPYGAEILQAVTDRPRLGAKLRALPFILHARGDVETVVRFHVDHLPAVLTLLKPYRRRQVSDVERERLRALSNRHGFGRQRISESAEVELESTQARRPPPDPRPDLANAFPATEVTASPVRARGNVFRGPRAERRQGGGYV